MVYLLFLQLVLPQGLSTCWSIDLCSSSEYPYGWPLRTLLKYHFLRESFSTTLTKNSAPAIHLDSSPLYIYFLSCLSSSHVLCLFICFSLEGSLVSAMTQVSSLHYLQCLEENLIWRSYTVNICGRNE